MSKTPMPMSADEFDRRFKAMSKAPSAPKPKKSREQIEREEIARYLREKSARVEKRNAWWKRFGIISFIILAIAGWRSHNKEINARTGQQRGSLKQRFMAGQNAGMEFYEAPEPVYHPYNGRVSFEVPLPDEHDVSSPVKTAYHTGNAGVRDVLEDTTATLRSAAGLAYAGADVRRGVETLKSAGVEGRAHRSAVRESRKRDHLRTERLEINNDSARKREVAKQQRYVDRQAEKARKEAAQRARAAERKAEQARKDAQRRADRARRDAAKYAKGGR